MASCVAGCLHSLGYDMPCLCNAMPVLDVDNIVEALTAHLQTWTLVLCIVLVQLLLVVLFPTLTSSGLGHTAFVALLSFACFWQVYAALSAI